MVCAIMRIILHNDCFTKTLHTALVGCIHTNMAETPENSGDESRLRHRKNQELGRFWSSKTMNC